MTETGKSEETTDLPLEGSPNRKGATSVDSAEIQSAEQEGAKSDTGDSAPPSSLALLKTPTSNRMSDAEIFKTPEALTPTSAKKRKRLTPDEKLVRDKERQEKRRKLEEEKQKKEQEKAEKAQQREAERLRKEEEKRRLEEEKRVEKLKREEERLKKEEEKKKLEEEKKQERLKKEEERKKLEEEKKQEKLKKEEERKKKEDEKKQKEEEKERERLKIEEKKAKQAQFFNNFFKKSAAPKVHTITIENGSVRAHEQTSGDFVGADSTAKNSALFNPLPFQIKTDMAIAPLCRRKMSNGERGALDSLFRESSTCADAQPDVSSGWLTSIKKGKGRNYGRTEIILKDSPEVQILEEETGNSKPIGCFKWRMKLLQFHENRRPAYWGTWKRKAKKLTARNPTKKEDEVDYDFDSDDEWEDEPEDAEEIGDSGDEVEDQEEGGDPADEDEEGWMVPHGYLSDSEREGGNGDLESLKCKEKEFYKSLKEKTMIGFPFIVTEDLSCYTMRLCPVFRSAVVKTRARRKRAPKKKVVEADKATVEAAAPTPPVAPPVVAEAPPKKPEEDKRKSQRKRKIADDKSNPYAKPPSGFLAMELPSDDEEDMDWDSFGDSEGSSSSGSESGDTDGEDESSSSDGEDLFIPITTSKSKK